MASITDCVVPNALVRMTMAFGVCLRILASNSMPVKGCKFISASTSSGSSMQKVL